MEGLETVSSAADLSASFSSEPVESSASDSIGAEPVSADNEGGDIDLEALNDTAGEDVEPPSADNEVNEEPAEEEEPEEQPVAEATSEEELPDGVRKGQDRSGKQGLFVTPERWKTIYDGGYKQLQTLNNIAGEPVTPELFDMYSRAHLGQEKLYGDLLSGDPKAVGSVLNHFLQEGARAMQEGEIGTDPIVPLATTFYGTLKENHPDAYAGLRMQAAKDLVEELKAVAGSSKDRNLWLSLGHVAKTLGLKPPATADFETYAQAQSDPLVAAQTKISQLEGQLNGRQANNQTAQFDTWQTSTRQAVSRALLEEAVRPALSEESKLGVWPKHQEAFNDLVVSRLHSAVAKTIKEDQKFGERINLLDQSARRATSAQKRAEIADLIKSAFINRARLAIDVHKTKILSDAGGILNSRTNATHQRRAAAANHKAPSGGGSPVKRSIVPDMSNFDVGTPGNLSASLAQLFR